MMITRFTASGPNATSMHSTLFAAFWTLTSSVMAAAHVAAWAFTLHSMIATRFILHVSFASCLHLCHEVTMCRCLSISLSSPIMRAWMDAIRLLFLITARTAIPVMIAQTMTKSIPPAPRSPVRVHSRKTTKRIAAVATHPIRAGCSLLSLASLALKSCLSFSSRVSASSDAVLSSGL